MPWNTEPLTLTYRLLGETAPGTYVTVVPGGSQLYLVLPGNVLATVFRYALEPRLTSGSPYALTDSLVVYPVSLVWSESCPG